MPRTYFAYNPCTDELLASPSFKRVYESALHFLQYDNEGRFIIYAIDVDFNNYTYKQVKPMFIPQNRRCRLRVLSNNIIVVNYTNGAYKSRIMLPKRLPILY